MRSSVVRLAVCVLRGAGLVWMLAAAGTAHAVTASFSLLVNTDFDTETGCVSSVGPLGGFEHAFTTVVEISGRAATVTRLERQACNGGVWGLPTPYDAGGWKVGFGATVDGADLVESYIPLSMLPPIGGLDAAVVGMSAGAGDSAGRFGIALDPVVAPTAVVPVPLSPWLVLPLAVGVVFLAFRLRRRHPQQAALFVFFGVFAVSGLVWAATVILDGNKGDWDNRLSAINDPKGDAPHPADIVAFFYQQDSERLYLRFDADLRTGPVNQRPMVSAGPDQRIEFPAAANLAGSVTDDGLPNPPGAITVSWSKVSGPGNATFGNHAVAATTASFSEPGVYLLRLFATDGELPATRDVTIVADLPGPNQPPTVDAGKDQSIDWGISTGAALEGSASDDGRPDPPGSLTLTWSKVSGDGSVTFVNASAARTAALFSYHGTYVLRLTAFDGARTVFDDVTIDMRWIPAGARPAPVITAVPQGDQDVIGGQGHH